MRKITIYLLALAAALTGCNQDPRLPGSIRQTQVTLGSEERLITLLATNDIHGGLEPYRGKDGKPAGGMAFWGGVVTATRTGLRAQFGDQAGMLVLDGGDQFQGTLLSNYSEGLQMIRAMNEVGYDAVVPGNHDYDFGPLNWLVDQVVPGHPDQDPRGALRKLTAEARFPLLSSNTYWKSTIYAVDGTKLEVDGSSCAQKDPQLPVDWARADRPDWLKPYVVRDVAGVRVALIGIDHPETPKITTAANVADLCFGEPVEAYLRARRDLDGQADVFVAVMHYGGGAAKDVVSKILKAPFTGRGATLDAVVAGHTHQVDKMRVEGVPLIQSQANGEKFGRVDLVYDRASGRVDPARTRLFGGVTMHFDQCAPEAAAICSVQEGRVAYEGVAVEPKASVAAVVREAREAIAPLAGQKLGASDGEMKSQRIAESNLANALTDALRRIARVDVAFINTGGIRAPLPKGEFTYEELFRVLPFSNHALVIGPMPVARLFELLQKSFKSCGKYGALMQSGLRVKFSRNCDEAVGELDEKASLLRVAVPADGARPEQVLFDAEAGIQPAGTETVLVATLDFLVNGGDGFTQFKELPVIRDYGIIREAMVEEFRKEPARFSSAIDGRWEEVKRPAAAPSPGPSPSPAAGTRAPQAPEQDPCGLL
jgi:5'-nucleotidase